MNEFYFYKRLKLKGEAQLSEDSFRHNYKTIQQQHLEMNKTKVKEAKALLKKGNIEAGIKLLSNCDLSKQDLELMNKHISQQYNKMLKLKTNFTTTNDIDKTFLDSLVQWEKIKIDFKKEASKKQNANNIV